MAVEWNDEGIVLGARRFGEHDAVVELLTFEHGRHAGLVKGGKGKHAALVQLGNSVSARWRARLDEQLGAYTLEPLYVRSANLLGSSEALLAASCAAYLVRLTAEREPHPHLYASLYELFEMLCLPDTHCAFALARFELAALADFGFGLDLSCCAATGQTENLIYVSPKSGCAVSEEAGRPYADRLLPLPASLRQAVWPDADEDVAKAFRLTGYFLEEHVLKPRGLSWPEERTRLLSRLHRSSSRTRHAG